MAYSTLYSIARTGGDDGLVAVKEATKQLDEAAPAATAYVVGTLKAGEWVCHGQPGDAIPKGATVYRDGSVAWTWDAVVAKFPQLKTTVVCHEFFGEFSAIGITSADFSRMSVAIAAEKP